MTEMLYEHPSAANGFVELIFGWMNTITGGAWGEIILFMIFSVSFIASYRGRPEESAATAMSLTWIISVLMAGFGAVSETQIIGGYGVVATTLLFLITITLNGGIKQ
jgi:hypothetical protein